MDFAVALTGLGVRADTLSRDERRSLDDDGFVVLRDVMSAQSIHAMLAHVTALLTRERVAAGHAAPPSSGTIHAHGVASHGTELDAAWSTPRVLASVNHILAAPFRMTEMQYRAPLPGFGEQSLHVDWPTVARAGEYQVCTAIVALVDFTDENGATRVVPGSHRGAALPPKHGHRTKPHPRERRLIGPAGTAFVFNGHVWHSGTLNRSNVTRHALLTGFARRSLDRRADETSSAHVAARTDAQRAIAER